MNNKIHIDQIIIEYNSKEEVLSNKDISTHIKECQRCNKLFERYFEILEILKNPSNTPNLSENECHQMFQDILKRTEKKNLETKPYLRWIAIAVSIVIILISSYIYLKQKLLVNNNYSEQNLIKIFQHTHQEDLDIISNFELFSNLEIIENLEMLEELNEVIDDEI